MHEKQNIVGGKTFFHFYVHELTISDSGVLIKCNGPTKNQNSLSENFCCSKYALKLVNITLVFMNEATILRTSEGTIILVSISTYVESGFVTKD